MASPWFLQAGGGWRRALRLVLIQTELPGHQDVLPVRLAVQDFVVSGSHRPEFQQCESQVGPGVIGTLLPYKFPEGDVIAVHVIDILAQPRPDTRVPVCRTDVALSGCAVVNDVNPFMYCRAPRQSFHS